MNLEREVRRAASVQADKDARPLPRGRIIRDKSTNEKKAEYHPQGYGLHFCLHAKTYYEVCGQCRRTRAEARRNLLSL